MVKFTSGQRTVRKYIHELIKWKTTINHDYYIGRPLITTKWYAVEDNDIKTS